MAETETRWSQLLSSLPRQLSLEGLRARGLLTPGIVWGLAVLAVLALLCTLWLWWLGRGYVPLYGRQEQYDTASVMEVMEREGISWRLHPDTGQVMISRSAAASARMALASAGIVIPVQGATPRKERSSSLGVSHFMERVHYIQEMEEALAATVRGLDSVRWARVHLSVPEQTAFLREQPGARASVFVDLYKGQALSAGHVHGIVALVAGSVTGLEPEDVSVVDQSGNLLSRQTGSDNERTLAAEQCFNARTRVEQHLESQVARLVEAVAGPGNYRVDVAVEMDFSSAEQATEGYGPDAGVVRSESMRMGDKQAAAPTSVTVGEGDAAAQPEQLTRNYEINKQISRISGMPGKLERVSVAVLLNYRHEKNGSAKESGAKGGKGEENGDAGNLDDKGKAWPDEEIAHLETLVQKAVGYDEKRSDSVSIVSLPFFPIPAPKAGGEIPDRILQMLNIDLYGVAWGLIPLLGILVILMFWLLLRTGRRSQQQADAPASGAGARQPGGESAEPAEEGQQEAESAPLRPAQGSVFSTVAGDRYFESYRDELLTHAREEPNRVAAVLNKWIEKDRAADADDADSAGLGDRAHE